LYLNIASSYLDSNAILCLESFGKSSGARQRCSCSEVGNGYEVPGITPRAKDHLHLDLCIRILYKKRRRRENYGIRTPPSVCIEENRS
jgi:hypothetical protein